MLYGVNFRSFHTAIHGIALFPRRKMAEQILEILRAYDRGDMVEPGVTQDDLAVFFENEVWGKAVGMIDEINYRLIQPLMLQIDFQTNAKGWSKIQTSNVRIVNPTLAVDVY